MIRSWRHLKPRVTWAKSCWSLCVRWLPKKAEWFYHPLFLQGKSLDFHKQNLPNYLEYPSGLCKSGSKIVDSQAWQQRHWSASRIADLKYFGKLLLNLKHILCFHRNKLAISAISGRPVDKFFQSGLSLSFFSVSYRYENAFMQPS